MRALRDDDADLAPLDEKTIAIIGYGNQGRAQALNLRDSGVDVLIGAIRDASAAAAEADGFRVLAIEDAVAAAHVTALLIPDEVQTKVYRDAIEPVLRSDDGRGRTLVFAHGYNIHFGAIVPPAELDVIMVAPRMIGVQVRALFEAGRGAPAYIAVAQDGTGHARETALAFAKAIGATRAGVLETTFAQETELDLFTEQATWPLIMRSLLGSFETLVDAGFPPEMVALELYGSGEASEVFREMSRHGLFEQMRFHSRTSQYGTLSRAESMLPDAIRERFRQALEEIRSGRFAREWSAEQEAGFPRFESLRKRARDHAVGDAESLAVEMVRRAGVDE